MRKFKKLLLWVGCLFLIFGGFILPSHANDYTDSELSVASVAMGNGQTMRNVSGSQNQWRYYSINIPSGATNMIIRTINGTGDVDIYVRRGSTPTKYTYDENSAKSGNSDICKLPNPSQGNYFIGLYAYYSYSGVNFTVSFINNGQHGISVHQANEMINQNKNNPNFMIVDVRTPAEYESSRVEDAVSMDFYCTGFHDTFNKTSRTMKYLIFCKTENRSSQAAMMMNYEGFSDFRFVFGGMTEWEANGYPVISGPNPNPPGP